MIRIGPAHRVLEPSETGNTTSIIVLDLYNKTAIEVKVYDVPKLCEALTVARSRNACLTSGDETDTITDSGE